MKKLVLLLVAIAMCTGYCAAGELEYFQVYTPREGMSADEIMQIEYFVKYTKFARDIVLKGKAFFVDKGGSTRERETMRRRITLGRKSDDIAYKDLNLFTAPTQVKGLATLSWTYMDPKRQQDVWLWIPSLKKIRKISSMNSDDSFMGSDFTVEDIVTRKFEDETYTLTGAENFKGYTCEQDGKQYFLGEPCFVIEARPIKSPWYYSKRVIWVSKSFGGGIYEEMYDPKGTMFKTIFKKFEIYKVGGKDYPTQTMLECKNLRSGGRTVIVNSDITYDQGLSEELLSERSLGQSRW